MTNNIYINIILYITASRLITDSKTVHIWVPHYRAAMVQIITFDIATTSCYIVHRITGYIYT